MLLRITLSITEYVPANYKHLSSWDQVYANYLRLTRAKGVFINAQAPDDPSRHSESLLSLSSHTFKVKDANHTLDITSN